MGPTPFVDLRGYLSQASVKHNMLTIESFLVFFSQSGIVLGQVCEYLCYHERHKGQADVRDMDLPPELSLELLMAADYLDGSDSCSFVHYTNNPLLTIIIA